MNGWFGGVGDGASGSIAVKRVWQKMETDPSRDEHEDSWTGYGRKSNSTVDGRV